MTKEPNDEAFRAEVIHLLSAILERLQVAERTEGLIFYPINGEPRALKAKRDTAERARVWERDGFPNLRDQRQSYAPGRKANDTPHERRRVAGS